MAERDGRPLIAVTGPAAGGRTARLFTAWCVYLAGGRSVQISAERSTPPSWVAGYVIGGGTDVHPAQYGHAPRADAHYDRLRDRFERGIIEEAIRSDRPLLGICRGAQLLNVHYGGTLHPSLRELRRHTLDLHSPFPVKWLHLKPGSMLARTVGDRSLRINSLHKQGVNAIGTGLDITGVDDDNLVQAVEDPTATFRLGVQWHPEYLVYRAAQRRLFAALVGAAAAQRGAVPAVR